MEYVTDVVYVPEIYKKIRSRITRPQTLHDVSSHAEQMGYFGFDATCEDGQRQWFRQLADGWNIL